VKSLSLLRPFTCLRIWRKAKSATRTRDIPILCALEHSETYSLDGSKHGPALGLFDDSVYANSHCELSAQDTLLLFTDGLFEVEGPNGDIYDYRRLLEAVNRRRELPAFQLCQEVIEEVERFSQGKHFSDDVCLVAMEAGPMSI
jgi:serine phosphatase RsbU (regulator of sigma subunit)